ncbi:hypothetical protein AN958_12197 [Leucoagaricus sp. SymC.cos]|nr:hypothetical protein AN958_12197 [Leucoagaricus sp. SymC.cos]
MFLMTFIAFVLLTLTTFSLPFIPRLYFLWSSQDGGVRFGIWGWCREQRSMCSEKLGMGYTWEPEIAIPITKALALYPVAAISAFMTLIAFIPILRDRSPRTLRVFVIFVWTSFVLAGVVFVFMIAMWSVADERFKAAGWKVHWGPLPWMSFIAMMLLLIVSLNSLKIISLSGALTSLHNSDPPFSVEGWSTTAEENQRIDSDPEKTLASPTAHSPSSVLKNVFPPPTPGSGLSPVLQDSETKEGRDSSPRNSGELTRKCSHRCRYDSLAIAKARLSPRQSSLNDNNTRATTAKTSTIATAVIPEMPSLPPRAFRRDSLQKKVYPQLSPLRT